MQFRWKISQHICIDISEFRFATSDGFSPEATHIATLMKKYGILMFSQTATSLEMEVGFEQFFRSTNM